jgi:hypothetical protein
LENLIFLELKRRGYALYYYKTGNGLEVDFACCAGGKVTQLIQVTYGMGEERSRHRELRALVKAMEETGLDNGLIITYEDEDEMVLDGKLISLIPAFKYLTSDY